MRLFSFAFDLVRQCKAIGHERQCALIDKASVLGRSAYFRRVIEERVTGYPDIRITG